MQSHTVICIILWLSKYDRNDTCQTGEEAWQTFTAPGCNAVFAATQGDTLLHSSSLDSSLAFDRGWFIICSVVVCCLYPGIRSNPMWPQTNQNLNHNMNSCDSLSNTHVCSLSCMQDDLPMRNLYTFNMIYSTNNKAIILFRDYASWIENVYCNIPIKHNVINMSLSW